MKARKNPKNKAKPAFTCNLRCKVCGAMYNVAYHPSCPKCEAGKNKSFIVFVDGMDGDVYRGVSATGQAVEHALVHGAKDIKIRRWKV